jgi:hypothetical protein
MEKYMRHIKSVTVAKANSWNDFWSGVGHSWDDAWGKNDNNDSK